MGAGTAMRFLTAYYAVTEGRTILTGTDRMLHRPIDVLVDALRSLGANIKYMNEDGFPPLQIEGQILEGGEVSLQGDVSSQFTSALLMVGPVMKKGLTIHLTGKIVSRPYIDLTLHLMNIYGANVYWEDSKTLRVLPTGYKPCTFRVENDWSAASYWYEIVALSRDKDACIILPGLLENSIQGDAQVRKFFESLGVSTTLSQGNVVLRKTDPKESKLDWNLENVPDLAQTLVVSCAMLNRPFKFSGLENLKIKETDRLKALKTEMAKFGFMIKISGRDTLSWDGKRGKPVDKIAIDTYDDHRMAMAFAPCCMSLPHLKINNPEVVSKSYPKFWTDLRTAGFYLSDY
jgi:3-phosphoshikimate 1-carboxyvinyltransferase